jgi:hypothetical protein
MYQIERRFLSRSVVGRIQREREPFRVIVPILLINVRDIHLQRSGQGLDHPLRRPIRLGSISHRGLLLLSHDLVERSEKVGHESGFTIMPDRLAGSKPPENRLFVILCDRLGGA